MHSLSPTHSPGGSGMATSPECSGDEHSPALPRVELGQIFLDLVRDKGDTCMPVFKG